MNSTLISDPFTLQCKEQDLEMLHRHDKPGGDELCRETNGNSGSPLTF